MGLEPREEGWVGDMDFKIISQMVVVEGLTMNEIVQGESPEAC